MDGLCGLNGVNGVDGVEGWRSRGVEGGRGGGVEGEGWRGSDRCVFAPLAGEALAAEAAAALREDK